MGLSNFKYADRAGLASVTGEDVFGAIRFRKDNEYMIDVPYGEAFSLPPNDTDGTGTPDEFVIFETSNGLQIIISYLCWVTEYTLGETYHMSAYMRVDDLDGVNVVAPLSIMGGTQNKTATSLGTPWDECYFCPGLVNYNLNNPTIVGEEAREAYFGMFAYKNVNQLLPQPFTGTQKWSSFTSTWNPSYFWPCSTDEQWNQRAQALASGGDGTDPTRRGQPQTGPDPTRPGGGDKPTYGPNDGDPIDFPALPSTSVIDTGLITLYNPTKLQLMSLANELWSNNFFDSISKILNDPFDALIGLSMLPFAVTTASTATAIKIGNYICENATAKKVSGQYVAISGGSFTLPLCWYNFLDFTATKVSLFLPFVGIVSVNIDDVMGRTIAVQYNIDVLSGAGICCVKCGTSVLYTFPVNVAYDVPLTGSNKAALYTGLIQAGVTAVGGAIMTGGAAGAAVGLASGAVNSMISKQSDVQRSGGLTSNSGIMGEFNCYLIIHRPVQAVPGDLRSFKGYMSNINSKLSACKGYTEVEYINLSVNGATDSELMEIKQLLNEGVII